MLYRRANKSRVINANDCAEVVKSYTARRPAEFVDGTKNKGRKDPLLNKLENHFVPDATDQLDSDTTETSIDALDSPKNMNIDTDTEESKEDSVFDDDGYDTDVTDNTELDGNELDDNKPDNAKGNYEVEEEPENLEEEIDDFGDAIRKHKALCYEDITL